MAHIVGVTTGILSPLDLAVRGELTRAIARLGYAPANVELARNLGVPVEDVEASLHRLHDTHSLQLHPNRCVPWVVHPFALSAGSCWVEVGNRGWWANCLYCGMGIAAALDTDADIHTRFGGERDPLVVHVRGGTVEEREVLFHLATPVRHWWDNVVHACSTFQPFRAEAEIDDWCARHNFDRGAVVELDRMYSFAADWYGDYVRHPWFKRTADDVSAVFSKHGLTGDFWRVA